MKRSKRQRKNSTLAILTLLLAQTICLSWSAAHAMPKSGSAVETRLGLGTLAPVFYRQSWATLAIDRSVQGKTITLGGREFATGLGTSADSEIVYDLNGAYDRFDAWVGVDAEMAGRRQASVRFHVLVDDKEMFNSGIMRADTPVKHVSVPVKGAKVLTLVVDNAGDGTNSDHADWAGAVLIGRSKSASVTPPAKYTVKAPGIELRMAADGRLTGINSYAVGGGTRLMGCATIGNVTAHKLKHGGMEFKRVLRRDANHGCLLTERFIPTRDSIRWEIEILGTGNPWSTAIHTELDWPATSGTRFWTAWSDPEKMNGGWHDPLVTKPMRSMGWTYGGVWNQTMPFITVPIATLIEPKKGFGVSLVMSPEDTLLDAALATTKTGDVVFTRASNRISAAHPVRFSMDIVRHAPDLRSGLGWMVKRYPASFNETNPKADEIAGLGAYSAYEGKLDAPKLKKMGFRVNWKASFDFPYMGMFIPPVGDEETWKPFDKHTSTSIRHMADYSKQMSDDGFYVLNYFHCFKMGNNVNWPAPPRKATNDKDLWKDPNDWVYYKMSNAWVRKPDGGPMFSWFNGVAADPADPVYHQFLIDQARLHVEKFPMSAGICIDSLAFMRIDDRNGDDGVSWLDGRPASFLMVSWKRIMPEIGRIMHSAGKVIFANPTYARLETMRQVDGFYNEFGYIGSNLNAMSFIALRKPAMAWTANESQLRRDGPDAYFQRHLYMGVFPTAPFPENDHSINPSSYADKWYLDYGPLFDALRGRKWVLVPQPIEVSDGTAVANVFAVPGGYVVPVVFGKKDRAAVTLRNLPGLSGDAKPTCKAIYPGNGEWTSVPAKMIAGKFVLDVLLRQGCAMVRITMAVRS